jgi:hypothetical protein
VNAESKANEEKAGVETMRTDGVERKNEMTLSKKNGTEWGGEVETERDV